MDNKLVFVYDPAPQRSPEWLERKRGKIGASRLNDWLAVSKAKTGAGKPLKARLDYEKELMFERQFETSFSTYVNSAMQEGIDYEDFARAEFMLATDYTCAEVGCYYNEYMAVSPDRLVYEKGSAIDDAAPEKTAIGVLEIKIVKDNTFTEILMADEKTTKNGVPLKHWYQVQAQLKATGLSKGWYVALNFNTKKFIVIGVEPDLEFLEYMMEAIQEELVTEPFALDKVHTIQQDIPEAVETGAVIDRSDSNVTAGDWSR